MYVQKNFSFKGIMRFSGGHLIWITVWVTAVACFYEFTHWDWLSIPWLPLSLIGTAVAFYVGFKNNQAYDRLWEARKIWGGIVNTSRAWGATAKAFVTDQFTERNVGEPVLQEIKRTLLYRHIAWLYTLREQLLVPTSWEHINQGKHVARLTRRRIANVGLGQVAEDLTEKQVKALLAPEEYDELIKYKNTATQIIDRQSAELTSLREQNLIDDFRHMELQNILNEFYNHQGKCERIKKFPLPRQYGSMSLVFIGIFIFLLPFGMVSEFHKIGEWGAWLSIPFTALVCWVYLMMELVGDYSENPFEGMGNDIPMLSLCRTIEIDLREMLGETELPPAIEPKNNVLM